MPASANARAMPRPMPLVEPVTIAVLPASSHPGPGLAYSAVTLCIAVSPDRKDRSVTCGWRTAEERDMSRSGFSRMSLFSEYQSHNVRVVLVVEQVSGQ